LNRSPFGRIPQETIGLLQQTRDQVRSRIVAALPPEAGQAERDVVTQQVIGIVLRDWQENGNTTGLTDEDVVDMQNFVRAAAAIAGEDVRGASVPVFEAVLEGMLADWLHNWNAPNDPGPPGPVD
jgi:hypothetical protein